MEQEKNILQMDTENLANVENEQETNTTGKFVTLEQLVRKKLEKEGRRNATKEIYVKSLGASIVVKNPTDEQKVRFSDVAKTGSYVDLMDGFIKIIYDCCPMLHSKELQDSINVSYPYDTVSAIFDTDEIFEIGPKIVNFFDDEKEDNADEKIKN